jgi:hypothetical protein
VKRLNLLCVVSHKWRPAESSDEGLRLVCRRCGRERSVAGRTNDKAVRDAITFDARRE